VAEWLPALLGIALGAARVELRAATFACLLLGPLCTVLNGELVNFPLFLALDCLTVYVAYRVTRFMAGLIHVRRAGKL